LRINIQHWIIDIVRASQAFIDSPEGAIAYYDLVSNPLEAAKDGVYITVTLVADHFMVSSTSGISVSLDLNIMTARSTESSSSGTEIGQL
jgi:hypothetical protein